ncbi:MAG: hypothetical protein LC808_22585, partial [Actinobacteria bacterium]|nr:hypothetical protein [Actinomycetota bacterium]
TGTDQLYPFAVSITRDGLTTTEQYTGTHYAKTITLAPTPLGARSITVKCTDPGGRASTQTRSVVGHDGAPPAVTIGAFDNDVAVTSLPYDLTLTGTTSGAQSGVTRVDYRFDNGPSGSAQNTGPGDDWSTWKVQVQLSTSGMYFFTITATDSRGGTGLASASINVRLALAERRVPPAEPIGSST